MIVPWLHGRAFRDGFKDCLRKPFCMAMMGLLRLHHLKTCDPKRPGEEVGFRLELVCFALHHEEGLLKDVFRRSKIGKECEDKPLDSRLIVDEVLEYLLQSVVAHCRDYNAGAADLSRVMLI